WTARSLAPVRAASSRWLKPARPRSRRRRPRKSAEGRLCGSSGIGAALSAGDVPAPRHLTPADHTLGRNSGSIDPQGSGCGRALASPDDAMIRSDPQPGPAATFAAAGVVWPIVEHAAALRASRAGAAGGTEVEHDEGSGRW